MKTSTNVPYRNILIPLAVLALALGGGSALAAGPGGDYVQAAYADWEDFDSGYNLAASFMAHPNLRLFADFTDTDLEHIRLGAAAVADVAEGVAGEAGVSYQDLDIDDAGEDDGFGVHGTLRFIPQSMPELTLAGQVEYIFLDEFGDETIVGFDVDWTCTEQVSVFAGYDIFDEVDENLVKVGARLNF